MYLSTHEPGSRLVHDCDDADAIIPGLDSDAKIPFLVDKGLLNSLTVDTPKV